MEQVKKLRKSGNSLIVSVDPSIVSAYGLTEGMSVITDIKPLEKQYIESDLAQFRCVRCGKMFFEESEEDFIDFECPNCEGENTIEKIIKAQI